MEDLKLVGVHDDGEHLLLVSPSGQRFRLHADEALRAAVRRDRARLGQLQIETGGGLRPREIQARIRAGESAQDVADSAGVPLDHVRRYEGPVLAERQFVAEQARAVRVRRPAPAPGVPAPPVDDETLGTVVAERLTVREVDPDAVEWDAWRTDDGTWVLTLDFVAGDRERRAQWSYDASVRHVAPLDDEARWLTEEEPPAAPRRLATVRTREEEAAAAVPDDSAATALLDTLALRRGRRSTPGDGPDPLREAIDTLRTAREARPEARPDARPDARPESRPKPAEARRGPLRLPVPARHSDVAQDGDEQDVVVLPDTEERAPEPPAPDAPKPAERAVAGSRAKAARGRRGVPSWDDIVFGSRKD